MKTEWDYTNLADAYLKRPDYAETALEKMLTISKMTGFFDFEADSARPICCL